MPDRYASKDTAMRTFHLLLIQSVMVTILIACSYTHPANAKSTETTSRPDKAPLVNGPRSPEGLQIILGTGDLGVGINRFAFVITSPKGFITKSSVGVTARFMHHEGKSAEIEQQAEAFYQPWPYGNRGMYTTNLEFDRQGTWKAVITVPRSTGIFHKADLIFEVNPVTTAPAIGERAIGSLTRTLADVESLSELSTGSLQDEDLYKIPLGQAIKSGLPTVAVFASPAFCSNAVCGPQVEILQQLKDLYNNQAHFIHIDFYENPQEIQGDLDKARISPAVLEWSLPSIEWTFVINNSGIIAARFEGFATLDEISEALKPFL